MESAEKARLKKEIMQRIGLSTREEAIAKSINDLSDEDKLEYFTNLIPEEDNSLSIMSCIADRYDIDWLKKFINKKLKLRTSVNGWRANQIVTIAVEKMKEERKSLLGRIFKRDKNDRWKVEEFE
jgi:hypothetical protein